MSGRIDSEPAGPSPGQLSFSSASGSGGPATAAAQRVWNAGLLLAASGLALAGFVVGRLFLTWRVTPHAASYHISLPGQRLSYPVANVDALMVLALALAGLAVGAITAWGAVREFAAARAFERHLAARADESAMNLGPGSRSALARAMLTFSEFSLVADSVGIDPRRVDYLLGETPSWRFPTLLCLAAAAATGLMGAIAILVGQVAAGSATLAPPFLSRQPCIVILALIPGLVGLGCAGLGRWLRKRAI